MNVGNCPRCGKVYVKNVKSLCPDCLREDEQMYEQVYRYLRDHPRSTATQVAEGTGVPEERVLAFLRDGRIQAAEWLNVEYPCERCGTTISTGRYCEKCAKEVQSSLRSLATQLQVASQSETKEKRGYHTEERLKKK